MIEPSKTLKWMVDELLDYHGNKYNEGEAGTKDGFCKLSREEVGNVCGKLYICGQPTWTLVLEDDTCRIPCILISSASNIERLFKLLGNIVVIRKGHLVAEKYASSDGKKPIVWLQVSVDEMFIIDLGRPSAVLPLDEAHWNLRILVVHVSTPIIISGDSSYSLLLVMTSLPGSDQTRYLWIALTGKQLQWNLFLIPNREYDIHMTCDKNYFNESIRPLRAVAGSLRGVKALLEVLHHPTMWPTFDAVVLPPDTEISLQPSLNRNKFNCKWPAVWWMSIDEALAQDSNQMTFSIWGEVVKTYEDGAREYRGCSLCALAKSYKYNMAARCGSSSSSNNFKMADADLVYNPWETALSLDEPLRIPTEQDSNEQCMTLSRMPEKLTKNVTLKDTYSGREVCLYVKNCFDHHYAPVFTPGVILCARLVQKRVSSSKNVYFTACALSSFEVVGCGTSMSNIGGSYLKYGFPYKKFELHTKVWGILDLWKLTKVSLSHISGKNSNPDDLYFSATAILQVDRFSGEPVIVCVKDSNVRTLLEIPLDIWTDLIHLSRRSPIEYSPHNANMRREHMDELNYLFHAYCSLVNAQKKRFHIVCRFLNRAEEHAFGQDVHRQCLKCIVRH